MLITAAVQRWWRGKKCNHIVWLTLAVPRRYAGLSYPAAATFGSQSLGRVWRKGSLGLDRAWKQHSRRSMRNIWNF